MSSNDAPAKPRRANTVAAAATSRALVIASFATRDGRSGRAVFATTSMMPPHDCQREFLVGLASVGGAQRAHELLEAQGSGEPRQRLGPDRGAPVVIVSTGHRPTSHASSHTKQYAIPLSITYWTGSVK